MNLPIILLCLLVSFNLFGQQDKDHPHPPAIEPIATDNIVVTAGPPSTLPGPSVLLPVFATVSVPGGDTNGVFTAWSFTESPGTVVFDSRTGLTNLAQFQLPGRHTITFRAQKGSYFAETNFYVFIVNQNITNFYPIVSILTPPNGSEFTAPVNIMLEADAQDRDGTIAAVTWYDGNNPIWTNTSAPYTFTLTNAPASNYVFAAFVEDNRGAIAGSTSVSVIVREPPTPVLTPPIVSIVYPLDGASLIAPITFDLTASVADLDGIINFVTFEDNDVTIGVMTPNDLETDPDTGVVSPYKMSVTPSVGTHVYRVTATDNDALQSSATSTVLILSPPNVLPSVSLTGPANGTTFTSPADIAITATASDSDGTISEVRFFLNGLQVGLDTSDPYGLILQGMSVGTYALYAQAVDNSGGVRDSGTNTVTVNAPPGVPPVVSLISPTADQVFASGATVTLTATATDDGSVTNVAFYNVVLSDPDPEFPRSVQSETLIGSDITDPYTIPWIPAPGTYVILAKAWDNIGLISTTAPPVTITVNPPIPPVVQLTSPTNGAVFTQGSTIAMTATASDQDGTVTKVDFMQFQPDVFIATDATSPYTGNWINVPAGSYSLVAKAFDSSGLTTISTAVHITITATPPVTVVVDAGPFPTAVLSPYKAYFDTEYSAQAGTFNSIAASGTGANYYNAQFFVDATISMYEGTKETNYINRALVWAETMVSKATIIDNSSKKNWAGIWVGADQGQTYTPSAIAYQLEEFQGATAMARAARVILADPDLRAVFGARATLVYNFVRDHIVNKNLITRNSYSNYSNWSTVTTSGTSDKPLLLLRLILDLKTMSALLGNSDTATYGWASKATELAEGIKDYVGREARFLPWQFPNTLIWGHGKNWQGFSDFDTSHANRLPFAVVTGYELGQTFTLTHVNGLGELLRRVLWDGSTTSPRVKNFMDGSNTTFQNRTAWNNGKTYDGWYMLGGYNTNVLNFMKYTALAVKNGVTNETLSYQNSNFGRTAMAGHIARAQALIENPPYAVLNGTVTGSGTTGTNWTHVAGPAGFTILTPNRPKTTVLFSNPSSVGSHTFRLTVTSGGPTVSDDVVVTVQAAPPFGTIGGGGPGGGGGGGGGGTPPTTTNMFTKRYIFYQTGNAGLTTTALRDRLINVIQRGAAVGYNGIVVNEGNCSKDLTPDATCLANLTTCANTAASLGMLFIPYTFSAQEPISTSPVEIREAVPVIDTKFTRLGGTGPATPVPDPATSFVNGGFETFSGNTATGWTTDNPGVNSFMDTAVKHGGAVSLRLQDPKNNPVNHTHARALQYINVTPFRQYVLSAWVKTEGYNKPNSVKFYVQGDVPPNGNQRILWDNRDGGLGSSTIIGGTQDWTQYVIDINSLENSRIVLYLSCSNKDGLGKVWFDDVTLTETGLFETIRRTSTPVVVKDYDGSPTYTEGSDYTVGSQQLSIPGGSSIPSGASLKVSFYQKANMMELSQMPASACNVEFFNVYRTNWSMVYPRFGSKPAVMFRMNEWRVGNWDPACGNITAGEYISNIVQQTASLVDVATPGLEKYVWNDIFDPYHNAKVLAMMMRGTMHNSWKGVPTNVVVMNWFNNGTTANMKFWDGLDPTFPKPLHRQMFAIYYDAGASFATANVDIWLSLLATAETQGVRGVCGVMYTTWGLGTDGLPGNYAQLENVANYIKTRTPNRWATNTNPLP